MSGRVADAPPLLTRRLRIQPLQPADASALRAVTDDPAIIDNIDCLKRPFGVAEAAALIGRNAGDSECFFGVWRGDALIGVVGGHLAGASEIEIGYWIGSASAGNGFATEAAGAVVAALRARFAGRRTFAECRAANRASWRVLAKLGFRDSLTPGARPGRRRLELPEA